WATRQPIWGNPRKPRRGWGKISTFWPLRPLHARAPQQRPPAPILASGSGARHIPEPMAGSPLKRQRKLAVRADDGTIIAFPRMLRVAELPRGWRDFGPAQKVEHLLNMSLDRAAEILSWGPVTDLDAHRSHLWLQVWRVVFMIAVKAHLDGTLGRDAALERN